MVRDDIAYLRRRLVDERALAEAASDVAVRKAHRDFADAYAQRLVELGATK